MILVARYDARQNNGQIRIYRAVRRATCWRIEIVVKRDGAEPEGRTIRVVDKMKLGEVHEVAIEAISEITAGVADVEEARMDFWADV